MNDIEELKQSLAVAESTLARVQNERAVQRRTLIEAEKTRIENLMVEVYDQKISDLHAVAVVARDLYEAAMSEQAKAGVGAPFPIGTKFYQWDRSRFSRDPYSKTGKVAVVEAVTTETVHPESMATYRMAAPGSYILRMLKKDGSPSKSYEKFNKNWGDEQYRAPWGWHPEGEVPK